MLQLPWSQIGLFALEGVVVALVLIGLFRLRRVGCLSPGALQHLQVTLAVAVYVEIAPNLIVSPGSAVLFPASPSHAHR